MSQRTWKLTLIIFTVALMFSSVSNADSTTQKGGKPRVVVLAISSTNTNWTPGITTATLEDAITQSGRFELISGAQRERVLKELKFSNSDVVDPSQATAIGKMLTARYIVIGNALDVTVKKKGGAFNPLNFGSEVKSRVQIQMIDAETGIVKMSKSFEEKADKAALPANQQGSQLDTDSTREAYRKALEVIATKFVAEFGESVPTETLVLLVRGGRVALELGADQVKVGQEFEVYSEDEPIRGADGKIRGYITTKYGRLRITDVEPLLSWATVIATYDENGNPDAQVKIERIKVKQQAKRVK